MPKFRRNFTEPNSVHISRTGKRLNRRLRDWLLLAIMEAPMKPLVLSPHYCIEGFKMVERTLIMPPLCRKMPDFRIADISFSNRRNFFNKKEVQPAERIKASQDHGGQVKITMKTLQYGTEGFKGGPELI